MSVVGVALVVVFEVNNEEEEEEEEEAFVLSMFWPSSNCAELRGESLEDSVGSAIVGGCVVWCGEQGFQCAGGHSSGAVFAEPKSQIRRRRTVFISSNKTDTVYLHPFGYEHNSTDRDRG